MSQFFKSETHGTHRGKSVPCLRCELKAAAHGMPFFSFWMWQVLDSLSHNRLPNALAHSEFNCCFCYGGCKIPEYAQSPHFWNQC